jgi:hypothetical protein
MGREGPDESAQLQPGNRLYQRSLRSKDRCYGKSNLHAAVANRSCRVTVDRMHTCKAPWPEAERSQRLTSASAAAIALHAEFNAHSQTLRFLKQQTHAIRRAYKTLPEFAATTQEVTTRADFSHELRSIWLAKDQERRTD